MALSRVLAIDPGKVRLGLAISDPERRIASPLQTYTRKDPSQDARFFQKILEEEKPGLIVVGLPVHSSGKEGEQARLARALGNWLEKIAGLPVVFYDERFTTLLAEQALWESGLTHQKRKERRDRVAAQILLQAFLEAGCPLKADFQNLEE